MINRKVKFYKKYLKELAELVSKSPVLEFKLETGKYYRNKANEIVQMMQKNPRDDGTWEYVDHLGNVYLENGKVIGGKHPAGLNELVGEVE